MKPIITLPTIGIICTLVGLIASSKEQELMGRQIKPCVVISGTDSHVSERKCYRITSAEEWTQLWQAHKRQKPIHEYDGFHDPLTLPLIDFDQYMVIAIFRGQEENNAGLATESIFQDKDNIVFRFWDKNFQTAKTSKDDPDPVKVTVYGFFIMPRSKKAIVVQENITGWYMSKSPTWKEIVRFHSLEEVGKGKEEKENRSVSK
jgi:hypothetical protein